MTRDRLIDIIETKILREVPNTDHFPIPDVDHFFKTPLHVSPFDRLIEYRLIITFGIQVTCQPEEIEVAKKDMCSQITHELYAGSIAKVYELKRCIMGGKRQEALRLCDDLLHDMK